jgi:hypothetical protein
MVGVFILSMGKLQISEVDGRVITWRWLRGRSGRLPGSMLSAFMA